MAFRSSQNKLRDSCRHSQGVTASTTLLPCCTHSTLSTCAITPLFFILVNMCSSAQKPPWQPLDRFRLSHQPKIWNALPGHLSSIPTHLAFRRALKHHLFLCAYPDSRTSGGSTPSERTTLCDTTPPAAIASLEKTRPSS